MPPAECSAAKGKPMIISCGMGSVEEIHDAVDACRRVGNEQIVLLKCCSEYPANYAHMNLATIEDMQTRFNVPIGISDHSLGALAALVGVSLGACVVEKHFCLSRKIKNPDSEFSMEPNEFSDMAKQLRAAVEIRGKISYELTESEKASTVFRRSVFAIKDIALGEKFTEENTRVIRPGNGMLPKHYADLLGRKSGSFISEGTPVFEDMVR